MIGGIGYWGGWLDYFIQRLIEFIRSIPTLPLWMALSAAFPKEWPALRSILRSRFSPQLGGQTGRRARGSCSLRSEDFVVAAVIAGV